MAQRQVPEKWGRWNEVRSEITQVGCHRADEPDACFPIPEEL